MDGEEEASDDSREDEDESDNDQTDVHQRVAQMLQNQQRYIQMCSSSAQILHMLSRLVPGMTISGQVMEVESVSAEESGDTTPTSEAPSAAHSPEMASEDNSGCVIWAEPFMTCQLTPSWKPYCDDVRRLPPGVRPEDLRTQNCSVPECPPETAAVPGTSSNRLKTACTSPDQISCTAAAAAAANGSVLKEVSTQTTQGDNRPPSAVAAPCNGFEDLGVTNFGTTHSAFNDAMLKISSAAKTIRHARNILAALNSRGQVNNNNNPEVPGADDSSQENNAGDGPESSTSANNDSGSKNNENTTAPDVTLQSVDGEVSCASLANLPDEMCQQKSFPTPLLVRAACEKADPGAPDETRARNDTEEQPAPSALQCQSGDSTYSGVCDQSSYNAMLSSSPSSAKRPCLFNRHMQMCRPMMGPRTSLSEFQAARAARFPRLYGHLYRPSPDTSNRAQHVTPPNDRHLENDVQPPTAHTINLPAAPVFNGKLTLDFAALNSLGNPHIPIKRHMITLEHLRNSLEKAKSSLQKLEAWMASERSGSTNVNSGIGTTVNTFTLTEVENFGNLPDQPAGNHQNVEVVGGILNDMIRHAATNSTDINAGGDGSRNIVNLGFEVGNISHTHHRSINRQPAGAQLDDASRDINGGGSGQTSPNISVKTNPCKASSPDNYDSLVNTETLPISSSENSRESFSHSSSQPFYPDRQFSSTHVFISDKSWDDNKQNTETRKTGVGVKLGNETGVPQSENNFDLKHSTEVLNKETMSITTIVSSVAGSCTQIASTNSTSGYQILRIVVCSPQGKTNEESLESDKIQKSSSKTDETLSDNVHRLQISSSSINGSRASPVNLTGHKNIAENITATNDDVYNTCVQNDHSEYATQIGVNENVELASTENSTPHDLLQALSDDASATTSNNTCSDLSETLFAKEITDGSRPDDQGEVSLILETEEDRTVHYTNGKHRGKYIDTIKCADQRLTDKVVPMIDLNSVENISVTEEGKDRTIKSANKPLNDMGDSQKCAQRRGYKQNFMDFLSAVSDESSNIKPASIRSVEDHVVDDVSEMSVTFKSASIDTSPALTPRTLDRRSFRRRFRRRSKSRCSKIERLSECTNMDVHAQAGDEKLSIDTTASKSDQDPYISMLPGFLPDETDQVCSTISGTFLKLTSGSHIPGKSPIVTPYSTNKRIAPAIYIDKELSKIGDNGINSIATPVMGGGGSSNRSSSSIETIVISQEAGLIKQPVPTSAETGLENQENEVVPDQPNKFRNRLRRFFSHCVRPFVHRN